jgi:Na+-translocating ferredoxin:NAD+ oxidoreductase RnfD subunit
VEQGIIEAEPFSAASHQAGPDAGDPAHPLLTHGGIRLHSLITMQASAALFPLAAGFVVFGWRAVCAVLVVLLSALGAARLWSGAGSRGNALRYDHVLWQALLLSLTLPAHLFALRNPITPGGAALWPILPAAGIMLVALIWLLGGAGSERISPVIITQLTLFVLFRDGLTPEYVLQRNHAVIGDVLHVDTPPVAGAQDEEDLAPPANERTPWVVAHNLTRAHARRILPAATELLTYTSGHAAPERVYTSLRGLIRDRMPPLEDLIVAGQPTAIGNASAVAILLGGLLLIYRGLIDFRIPLYLIATALVAMLVLPVPIFIGQDQEAWQWIAMRHRSVGPALGITFANYELLASPLLLTAFFFATAPSSRPMTRRARTIFAPLIGLLAAIFQLYASVSIGPYLALLAASLLTPWLDRPFRPRTLV